MSTFQSKKNISIPSFVYAENVTSTSYDYEMLNDLKFVEKSCIFCTLNITTIWWYTRWTSSKSSSFYFFSISPIKSSTHELKHMLLWAQNHPLCINIYHRYIVMLILIFPPQTFLNAGHNNIPSNVIMMCVQTQNIAADLELVEFETSYWKYVRSNFVLVDGLDVIESSLIYLK